jgi:hypothetical protein
LPTAVWAAKRWVMDLEVRNDAKKGATSERVSNEEPDPRFV